MDKHVFAAALRLNKSVPLLGIEPLTVPRDMLDLRCWYSKNSLADLR